jgi:autotransporter-associated beta strand protein
VSQLRQHLSAYWDGELDAEGVSQLSDRIRHSPDDAYAAAKLMLMHTTLSDLLTHPQFDVTSQINPIAKPVIGRIVTWRRAGAVVAAVVTLAFTAWLLLAPSPTPKHLASESLTEVATPVAMLSDVSADAVFADSSAPMILGSGLQTGPFKLTSGKAQIMFNSTAVVDLVGPCEFEMTGPNRGRLTTGTLEAYVPERARGFSVDLPSGARVVDLGTRFSVMINSDGSERVYVFEGLVEVAFAEESLRASAGQTLNISAAGLTRINSANNVTLTANDPSGTSSFNTAGKWSDGLAPSPGKTYATSAFGLRTPGGGTFAGDSLSVDAGGGLGYSGSNSGTITVNNLILNGGRIITGTNGHTFGLAGSITANTGTTNTFDTFYTSRTIYVTAPIRGDGNLIKAGSGTLILDGTHHYTGTTSIQAGAVLAGDSTGYSTFLLNGTHAGGGRYTVESTDADHTNAAVLGGNGSTDSDVTVNPGGRLAPGAATGNSTGALGVGYLTLSAGAHFDVQIGGTTAGAAVGGYDQLNVAGTATLNGIVNVSLLSYTPNTGNSFDILTASHITNADLSAVTLDYTNASLGEHQAWEPSIISANGRQALRLTVVAAPVIQQNPQPSSR